MFTKRVVSDSKEALLTLNSKSVCPAGGSKYVDMILFVVIELKVGDVDDVMEASFVDRLSLMSVCVNVCVFV